MAVVVLAVGVCAMAQAAVVTRMVEYECGGKPYEGMLAYDDSISTVRPGVLVVHEFWGLNDYPKERARALAQMGYVAFAADMYGKGIVATAREEASKLAGQFRGRWEQGGRQDMRDRARAALAVLAGDPHVDPTKLAAIGYCFGGTVALELAYSGADLRGVASFHGGLTMPEEADLPNIKAKILILHGGSDAGAKPETIASLQAALTQAQVDWEMVTYGGAVHGFSNPGNTAAYQEAASRRSWAAMKAFFGEIFGA
jgi:dienelactone hydrolase